MNRRNFKRVLSYIEKNPDEWRQSSCQSCFLVLALRLLVPRSRALSPYDSRALMKKLGLNAHEMADLYYAGNTFADLVRFHKTGAIQVTFRNYP